MFTLVQLRCFVAVAEDLNFRQAARRLNMTQPPLTRHIQALEHEVGAELLDRTRRAVRLTPAGTSFARSARRILDAAAGATREAQQVAGGDAGAVTIGFTAASSYVFLPNLIMSIRQQLPGLSLTLREMATPQQIAALSSGQIDIGLLRPLMSLPGISQMRVQRERLVVAVPSHHPLSVRPSIKLEELSGETLITYPPVEGPYFHGLIMGLLHTAGVAPASLQYITQTHSILALVGAGLGAAIVPEAAGSCLPTGVTLRPLSGAEGVRADLALAWRTATGNAALELVVALVRGSSHG